MHRRVPAKSQSFFFFNDTATTEIYTLSLHDALPISRLVLRAGQPDARSRRRCRCQARDRKSTRLNSSHDQISYAVFCLKKKKFNNEYMRTQQNKNRLETNSSLRSSP